MENNWSDFRLRGVCKSSKLDYHTPHRLYSLNQHKQHVPLAQSYVSLMSPWLAG
jgi:hypothetical protein